LLGPVLPQNLEGRHTSGNPYLNGERSINRRDLKDLVEFRKGACGVTCKFRVERGYFKKGFAKEGGKVYWEDYGVQTS